MSEYLREKVILITGAGSGFGRLIAERCAAGGARVVAVDIDEDALGAVVAGIAEAGGRATSYVADVTVMTDMSAAVNHTIAMFGTLEVLVNNVGIMPLGYFREHDRAIASWHKAIDVNLKGVLNGMCAVHDQMLVQGRGQIVNIASIYANAGIEGSGVYSATKAAIAVLSDAFRTETKGKITVSTIKPTGVFGTNLRNSVVNPKAVLSLTGQRADIYRERVRSYLDGSLPGALTDKDSVSYWLITPDDIARAVVTVIDQPWGISYSDLTVRASGEDYIY